MSKIIALRPHQLVPRSTTTHMHELVRNFVSLYDGCTEVAGEFLAWVFLVLLGHILGRQVHFLYPTEQYLNLFVLLLGKTGFLKKDTAIRLVTHFMGPVGTIHSLDNISSPEGLITQLAKQNSLLLSISEFSSLVMTAQRRHGNALVPALCKLFDAPPRYSLPTRNDPLVAEAPYLSLIAATTPERAQQELTLSHLDSGFLNRIAPIVSSEQRVVACPSLPAEPDIEDLRKLLVGRIRCVEGGATLTFSRRSEDAFRFYYEDLKARQFAMTDELAQAVARVDLHCRKLAGLFSVLSGETTVSETNMSLAIRIAVSLEETYRDLVEEIGASALYKIQMRIQKAIQTSGPIVRRELQQRIGGKNCNAVQFNMVLDALIKAGAIKKDNGKLKWVP